MSGERRSTCWGLLLTVIVALLVFGCAAPVASEEAPTSSVQQAVVGGEVDSDDESTVALLLQDQVFCTGVLISKTVVLTAAHCVQPSAPDEVYFGTSPGSKGGTRIAVSHARAHDEFDEDTLDNDIAVLQLATAATATPAKLRTKAFSQDTVGKAVRLVGFGLTAGDADAKSLKKRSGQTTIDSFGDLDFRFKPNPATTCSGDSGGPAFDVDPDANGDQVIVGIASSGDADCLKSGRHVRVDAYLDFITENAKAYALPTDPGDVESSGCSTAPARRGSFGAVLFGALALVIVRRRRRSRR